MRRSSPISILPSPYFPEGLGRDLAAIAPSSSWNASLGPGNANAAIYLPCYFPMGATLASVSFRPVNTTGNYDFGLYDSAFNRVASKGSTAMANAQVDLSLSNYRVKPGGLVWVALALSSTSGRFAGISSTTANLIGAGCQEQASALALPNPATPAAVSSWLHVPVFMFAIAG